MKLFLTFILLINTYFCNSQVTIGSNKKAVNGALLQLKQNENIGANSNLGLMLPKVQLTDSSNLYPIDNENNSLNATLERKKHVGLLVFVPNLWNETYCPGPYIWDGDEWIPLTNGSSKWILDTEKSDDFNDSFNDDKWSHTLFFELSNVFALRPENSFVEDGNLVILADKKSYWSKEYVSGGISSKFQVAGNSRVEIRAKLPNYEAHVSAPLWMVTNSMPNTSISTSFEIDLCETYLNENTDHEKFTSTLHYWWVGDIPEWLKERNPEAIAGRPNEYWQRLGTTNYFNEEPLSEDYHIWAIERINNRVDFYFDNKKYWSHNVTQMGSGKSNPFLPIDARDHFNNQPINIICTIQGHGGVPNDSFLPVELLVDYIHVYKKVCQE